jgi:DMSO reductase family type II enzyme chaperone
MTRHTDTDTDEDVHSDATACTDADTNADATVRDAESDGGESPAPPEPATTATHAITEPLDVERVDRAAAARGGLYALLATLFDEPDASVYARLAEGEVDATCRGLLDAACLPVDPPDLTVEDDHETLCARFNDLFTVGYAEYEDRTDGSLDSEGPPVSLYESAYRPDASWNEVNLDLARAYDHFGLGVDSSTRDNHDYLPYLLEFAGYLARQEADGSTDAARARLDLHDRHLHVVATGLAERTASEAATGLYGELAAFLDRLVSAEQDALAARFDGGEDA